MRIVIDRPPIWQEVIAKFPMAKGSAIFTWGNIIYNPSRAKITPALHAHEEIHAARQGVNDMAILSWWHRYLDDPLFRLLEELPAHQAEYRAFCKRHASQFGRARFLSDVAQRLGGPLYGNLLSIEEARRRILCSPTE